MAETFRCAVVGQVARDLVLALAGRGFERDTVVVRERREVLGGKGANQAVGLRQLGADVALIGVVGDDDSGADVRAQAESDGIDCCGLVSRGTSALLVDAVDDDADRRLLEHVPGESLLTVDDVRASAETLRRADVVCVQLQQPGDAIVEAVRIARDAGRLVALDGGIDGHVRATVLPLADIVRADAAEAEQLAGFPVGDEKSARRAAEHLHASGPRVVALTVPDAGNLVSGTDESHLFPHGDVDVVDRTGGGDAFFAGLVTGIGRGWNAVDAGQLGHDAAAATVQRLGGRPDLAFLHSRVTDQAE